MNDSITNKALEHASSRMNNWMRLNATAAIVVTLAIFAAQADLFSMKTNHESTRDAFLSLHTLSFERAWAADSAVLRRHWNAYDEEELDQALRLAFLITTAQSFLAAVLEPNESDEKTIDEVAAETGEFAQRLNEMRIAYARLHIAASTGLAVRQFETEQWSAYRTFLEFEDDIESWAKTWTKICRLASLFRYIESQSQPSDSSFFLRLVRSEQGQKLLKWGHDQLIAQSDEAGDLISLAELYPTEAFERAFFQLVRTSENEGLIDFRTIRDAGLAYVWKDRDLERVTPKHISDDIGIVLFRERVSTIDELQEKNDRLKAAYESADAKYLVPIPIFGGQWPLQSMWPILLVINFFILAAVIRLRYRLVWLLGQLSTAAGDIRLLVNTWSYDPVIFENNVRAFLSSTAFFFRAVRDSLCLFGLFFACGLLWMVIELDLPIWFAVGCLGGLLAIMSFVFMRVWYIKK